MRIGLDLDGVVYDFIGAARGFCWREWEIDVGDVPTTWNWLADHLTSQQIEYMWTEGVHRLFRQTMLFTGAVEFIRELDELGQLIVVTSRPKKVWKQTVLAWYNEYPVLPAVSFEFSKFPNQKAATNCDVYIDDHPKVRENLAEKGKRVLLFDAPYNQEVKKHMGIERVHSYQGIIDYVKDLEKGLHWRG